MLLLYSPHHYLRTERFIFLPGLLRLTLGSSVVSLPPPGISWNLFMMFTFSLLILPPSSLKVLSVCLCGHVCTVICVNVHICILSPEDVWNILISKEKNLLVRNLLPGCYWSLYSLLQLPIVWFCLSGRGLGLLDFAHLFCLSSPGPPRSAADLFWSSSEVFTSLMSNLHGNLVVDT